MIRRHIIMLPLLVLAACAQGDGRWSRGGPPAPTALRFANALEEAETAVDASVAKMDGFERMAAREDAAIAFASGGQGGRRGSRGTMRSGAMPASAAEAAGQVLDPAFTAVGDYGDVLSQVAAGERLSPESGASGAELSRAAAEGLDAVRRASGTAVSPAVRAAGLAGIAALADLTEDLGRRGRSVTVAAMVAEAQPHLAAVSALLRAVIGPEPTQGTRGAILARREGLNSGQARFLDAVRADARIGAGERYSIYRSVVEMRDNDPAEGQFAAVIALLEAMEEAHGALGAESADAAGKVSAFEAAVDRLERLSGIGGQD